MNEGKIEIEKVRTEVNKSDALTKYKDEHSIEMHLKGTNQVVTSGRHSIMPKLANTIDDEDDYDVEVEEATEENQLNNTSK